MPVIIVNNMVDYQCDLCGQGFYRPVITNRQANHQCSVNTCGHLKQFDVTYPHAKPEEDSGSTEWWRQERESRKARKDSNRERAIEKLQEHGIVYSERNNGIHFIINGNNANMIDYWPTTGLWNDRANNHSRRGITSLLKYLGIKEKTNDPE